MIFRIADTFSDSLARLTGEEQKAVKVTAMDLQLNPANPGHQFHKLEKSRDRNFWSVRASSDLRLIVHRSDESLLLCYVDHHDRAYSWAERRKLETHPRTGAAQLVELRETVQEIVVPSYVMGPAPVAATSPPAGPARLFDGLADEDLLGWGVPVEWLADVREATEASVLALAEHLPAEAAEAILELATGGTPRRTVVEAVPVELPSPPAAPSEAAFAHPDAQRRFRVMTNVEELERALEAPWERWTIFLHPEQRQWVEREYGGPARVSGSAGTGKTIVALHRAVFLARKDPEARVLLTTFSDALANALRTKLLRLAGNEPRLMERIDVLALDAVALRTARSLGIASEFPAGLPAALVSRDELRGLLAEAARAVPDSKFSLPFLVTEWEDVVDAWQLTTWEAYRDVVRLGRRTRLPEAQRRVLWTIFDSVRRTLAAQKRLTLAQLYGRVSEAIGGSRRRAFDHIVVDEAQDLSVPQLRWLAALADGPEALFFAGDLGQRIFQQPFSWKSLGVDVRGRSRTLRVNYRTSHQIRTQADRLLDPTVTDPDGNLERRDRTISVFNGRPPEVRLFESEAKENAGVAQWMKDRRADGVAPHELGVFVRSEAQLDRARAAVAQAGIPARVLDDQVETQHGHASIGTMHLAKGLEFRAVVVMACDDEVVPLQERIETAGDESDLKEVYETERHLLYVACTRARDFLLVTGVGAGSEFLGDLQAGGGRG